METDAIHGLTAAYALNALDPREAAEYEAHLARCGECQRELASLQGAAASLAFATDAPAPPDALRERILVQARAERSNVVPLRPRWLVPAVGAAAAAAATVAIALGVWAASLSSQLDAERSANAERDRALAVLAQPGSQRFPLEGASGAVVVAEGGEAALVVSGLPDPGDKVYEMWVSSDGKTMLPAGTFRPSARETVVPVERAVPEGGLVAVTLEEREVDEPTGPPLFTAETA